MTPMPADPTTQALLGGILAVMAAGKAMDYLLPRFRAAKSNGQDPLAANLEAVREAVEAADKRRAEQREEWRQWADGQTRTLERICASLDSQTRLLDHAATLLDDATDRSRQRHEEIMDALARVARETGAGRE